MLLGATDAAVQTDELEEAKRQVAELTARVAELEEERGRMIEEREAALNAATSGVFFFETPRSRPTANAEGLRRSEGT